MTDNYKASLVGIIGGVALLAGCTNTTAELSDFQLKEKCSQYVPIVQKRVDEWDESNWDFSRKTFEGVYYSKDQETCISIVGNTFVNTNQYQEILTDELSGKILYFGERYEEAKEGYKLLK